MYEETSNVLLGRFRFFCLVLGVLPYRNVKNLSTGRYEISRLGMAFSVINLLLILGMICLCYSTLTDAPVTSMSGSVWLDYVSFTYTIAMAPIVIVIIVLEGRKFCEFSGKLSHLDAALENFVTREEKTFERHILVTIVATYSTLMCYTGMELASSFKMPMTLFVTLAWTRYVVYMLQCQFVLAVVAVRIRYERLNRLLELRDGLQEFVHWYQLRRPNRSTIKRNIAPVGDHFAFIFALYEELNIIGGVLVNVSAKFNVLYVLDVFINSVIAMVLIFRIQMSLERRIPVSAASTLTVVSIVTLVNMAIVMMYCQMTTAESQRTALCLHKTFNKSNNNWKKIELILFSKQLIGRKIVFTACGMFPLDFSLLYSTINAVSIYLVTLMQFQLKQ